MMADGWRRKERELAQVALMARPCEPSHHPSAVPAFGTRHKEAALSSFLSGSYPRQSLQDLTKTQCLNNQR